MLVYLLKILRSARLQVQVIVCFTNGWQPLQAMAQGSTSVRMRSEAVSSERSECAQFTDSSRLREIVAHGANGKIFVQSLYTSTHRNTLPYKNRRFYHRDLDSISVLYVHEKKERKITKVMFTSLLMVVGINMIFSLWYFSLTWNSLNDSTPQLNLASRRWKKACNRKWLNKDYSSIRNK